MKKESKLWTVFRIIWRFLIISSVIIFLSLFISVKIEEKIGINILAANIYGFIIYFSVLIFYFQTIESIKLVVKQLVWVTVISIVLFIIILCINPNLSYGYLYLGILYLILAFLIMFKISMTFLKIAKNVKFEYSFYLFILGSVLIYLSIKALKEVLNTSDVYVSLLTLLVIFILSCKNGLFTEIKSEMENKKKIGFCFIILFQILLSLSVFISAYSASFYVIEYDKHDEKIVQYVGNFLRLFISLFLFSVDIFIGFNDLFLKKKTQMK